MALTWDVTRVPESIRLGTRYDEKDQPFQGLSLVTEALIWLTLTTGIGEIKESNAGKFFARVALYERLNGPMIREGVTDETGAWTGQHKDRPITEADVIAHVGLKTNASFTDEPRAKWLKRIVGDDMDRDVREVKKALAARLVSA